MSIKLIATDMDQTVLRSDKTYDSKRLEQVINQLHQKGVVFVVASGNSHEFLQQYLKSMQIEDVYIAGDNGNYLAKSEKVEHIFSIPRTTAKEIVSYIESLPERDCLISTTKTAYTLVKEQKVIDEFLRYNSEMNLITDLAEIPSDEEILKIAVLSFLGLEQNKQLAHELKTTYSGVTSVTSADEWVDVYHKDGGKGAAVTYLQHKYHISPEETIAFGDSLNDLPMMQAVIHSVAMSNADDALKAHCRYQIGSNEEQAVITTLEQLLKEELSVDFLR
ncbi:hypothetical protein SAMN05421767_1338 [Granulicatella balaenopterae]|uniref:Cof subfamily of IIB subfamily of haloacid dehalogenase superfamily/HAD-superfamily hydrolase, subfamily IIB n=1 Tax=Granulicatella balaenopterae TaxID=137733 RepID=A0A1H9N0Z8_9LACT|nr:HAD family hydrolase [Granulicatella balaenopterae]SER29656.1 hypothetical protein SAMN05421767_1338 [Granulicatella balaenopterae]